VPFARDDHADPPARNALLWDRKNVREGDGVQSPRLVTTAAVEGLEVSVDGGDRNKSLELLDRPGKIDADSRDEYTDIRQRFIAASEGTRLTSIMREADCGEPQMESELIPDRQCELVLSRCVGRKLGAQTLQCLLGSGESRAISSRLRLTSGGSHDPMSR
jgi:hypothetical protein